MLTDLTLLQFRSHRRAELSFDRRPVAIHGPNGAGKTSILEAVSLLSPGRGLRRAAPEDLIRQQEAVGWKVRATLNGHDLETSALPDQTRNVRIDDKAAPQIALGRLARVLWLVPSMDRLWIDAPEGRRRFLDRMAMSFVPEHADAVLAYEKAMRERNRLLKDNVTDRSWYTALEARMAAAAHDINTARRVALDKLQHAQDSAETTFPVARLNMTNEGPADLADALARGRSRDMAAGRTLDGPHRADLNAIYTAKETPVALCSTGEQKALLISLLLANARALAGETVVLLLDEVAAHLDGDRRAALYDEICAMSAQVFMTGTDIGLFDSLGERGQHLRVTETNSMSQVQRLT